MPTEKFTLEQRIFMYDTYVKTESCRDVCRQFSQKFPGVAAPGRETVRQHVMRVRETGSINARVPHRKRTILTEERLDEIGASLECSQNKSLSLVAQEVGVSKSSAHTATKLLKLRPRGHTIVQEEQPRDKIKQTRMRKRKKRKLLQVSEFPESNSLDDECMDVMQRLIEEKRKILQVSEFPESNLLDDACMDTASSSLASPLHMEPDIGGCHLSSSEEPPAPEFMICSIKTEPQDVDPSFSPHNETISDYTLEIDASTAIKSEPADDRMDANAPDTLGGSSCQQNFQIETVTNALEQQESIVDTLDESAQFVLGSVFENGHVNVKVEPKVVIKIECEDVIETEPDIVIKTELEIENDGSATDGERYSLQSCDIGRGHQEHMETGDNSQFQENSSLSNKTCYQGEVSEAETTELWLDETAAGGSVMKGEPNLQLDVREGHFLTLLPSKNAFSCTECSKVFGCRDQLENHMRIHTGEKQFWCSICNKSFGRKQYIRKHSQIHSGEKPFVCSTCNKAHSASHTGKKTYTCATCNQAFPRKRSIKKHLRKGCGQE